MFRTLIVEDNAVFRQSFRESLHMRFPHMVVDEAPDGEQALQKIDSFRPELVFMDILLPGENGLEVTKKIKTGYPATTIIIYHSDKLRSTGIQRRCQSIRGQLFHLKGLIVKR